MRGWVYIITNRAMPDLIKVGYSHRDPIVRATELDGSGMPHPYVVAFDVLVHNPDKLEKEIHAALLQFREGKEWFRISVLDAAEKIRSMSVSLTEFVNKDFFPDQSANNSSVKRTAKPVELGLTYEFNGPHYSSCKRCSSDAQWGTPIGPLCDLHYKKWKQANK